MIAEWLMNTPLPQMAGELLRTVPGLPPVLQTLHLLGVAVLMGSVVMLALRVLNAAARRQDLHEMAARLWPWFVGALPVMVISGLPFFLARPQRYLNNPVFEIKFAALAVTLLVSIVLWLSLGYLQRRNNVVDQHEPRERAGALIPPEQQGFRLRLLAVVTVAGWVLTTLAGRWIAYADYLFWPG